MPSENSPPTPHAAGPTERRSGRDRRRAESSEPPPGGRERRRNMEPRKPEVAELDLSLSQWDALNELPLPDPPSKK